MFNSKLHAYLIAVTQSELSSLSFPSSFLVKRVRSEDRVGGFRTWMLYFVAV